MTMWQKNHKDFIGKLGFIMIEGMRIDIEVAKVRERYGELEFRVVPVCGTGGAWLKRHKVDLMDTPDKLGSRECLEEACHD